MGFNREESPLVGETNRMKTTSNMNHLPEPLLAVREQLSRAYLAGDGIEIGALYEPLWTSPAARVRYVDRMDVTGLREAYPELKDIEFCHVDIVDDGEHLNTFPNSSLNFIIANHVLEHCENPIGAVRAHLSKLKPGGVLYYAVPDKRNSFDRDRPITSFEHVVADDTLGVEHSRWGHYVEYVTLVGKRPPDEVEWRARRALERSANIHFHVWDEVAFRDFLTRTGDYLGSPPRLEHFQMNDTEMIAILRKV